MTPNIIILKMKIISYYKLKYFKNILVKLLKKQMFLALNESEKQSFNPKGICHAFKDYDGNPTNIYE